MGHEKREFLHCVNQIFDVHSVLDEQAPEEVPAAALATFVCNLCSPAKAFATEKACDSHCRSKHGMVSCIPKYINGSGICPACGTKFQSRIRVIAHLSDKRRPACRDRVLNGEFPLLPEQLFVQLQEADRHTRKMALHDGHTHPIAQASAVKADGRRVGRVTR